MPDGFSLGFEAEVLFNDEQRRFSIARDLARFLISRYQELAGDSNLRSNLDGDGGGDDEDWQLTEDGSLFDSRPNHCMIPKSTRKARRAKTRSLTSTQGP